MQSPIVALVDPCCPVLFRRVDSFPVQLSTEIKSGSRFFLNLIFLVERINIGSLQNRGMSMSMSMILAVFCYRLVDHGLSYA